MSTTNTTRKFDLLDRTLVFAKAVQDFLRSVPRTDANKIYCKQLLRCSSSVGANYIEANDALGRNDFFMKIRTCRREARESSFFIRLLELQNISALEERQSKILDESLQLVRIFSSIANMAEKPLNGQK